MFFNGNQPAPSNVTRFPLTLLDSREILLFNHIMAEFLKMHFIVPFHVISTEENRYKIVIILLWTPYFSADNAVKIMVPSGTLNILFLNTEGASRDPVGTVRCTDL